MEERTSKSGDSRDSSLHRIGSDWPFLSALGVIGALYVLLIVAMLVADVKFMADRIAWDQITSARDAGGVVLYLLGVSHVLASPEIRFALTLSLISCFMTALLSLWVAVPVGYLMSRYRFPGKGLLDAVLDIPIVLPPLVIGLSLLILFQTQAGRFIEQITEHSMGFLVGWVLAPFVIARIAWAALHQTARAARWESLSGPDLRVRWSLMLVMMGAAIFALWLTGQGQGIDRWAQAQLAGPITYAVPAVILAQFTVACAFAVRTMRVTFDQISPRSEQVAMTLGCSRRDAFWRVVLPEAWRGMLTAGTLAWARALGEFGPILIFAGATRMRTEVLPTTIFLELSVGNIEAAVAVSILMVICAMAVLLIVRSFGPEFIGKAVRP